MNFRRWAALWCLAALFVAGVAQARVAVIVDVTQANLYSASLVDNTLVNQRALLAVRTILDRYKAPYDIIPKSQALTYFCRTGVFKRALGGFSYDSLTTLQTYDAVIHVGFNGVKASTPAAPYRADSLTVFDHPVLVPQLMLLDEEIGIDDQTSFDNGAADSTWVESLGQIPSGGGTGNHEGEGSSFTTMNDFRWFETIFGVHYLKKSGQPNGGLRVLLAGGANASATNLNLTGNMPLFIDSLSTATSDTMRVWERTNAAATGRARVVFASVMSTIASDSVSSAGSSLPNTYASQGVDWPTLLFAMAHLDSLANGNVLGKNKVLQWGAIITGAGGTSDRRHPGGFFLADSNIVAASCDSLGTLSVPLVVAADPESLTARPWQVAIFNRIKTNRWAPWVRSGLDSTVAGNGNSTLTSPKDVWGRYRNRAIYGDSLNHAVSGNDTSVFANLSAATKLLRAQVGDRISKVLLAPDFDFSPYQLRAHQNAILADSLLWLSKTWGGPIVVNVQDRDRDPAYLRTNPKGWVFSEGSYSTALSGRVNVLGVNGFTVLGSRSAARTDGLSFQTMGSDTTAPFLSADPGPNCSVLQESAFWNGFFGPSRDYQFRAYDGLGSADEGVYVNTKDRLYGNPSKASILVLPAQSLGGQDINGPNRWGYFVIKHLVHASRAINAAAGRTIITPAYPEDIRP